MRYELWQDENEYSYSFFPEENESARSLLSPAAKLIWECETSSWEEAMSLRNEFLGWERYIPMDED